MLIISKWEHELLIFSDFIKLKTFIRGFFFSFFMSILLFKCYILGLWNLRLQIHYSIIQSQTLFTTFWIFFSLPHLMLHFAERALHAKQRNGLGIARKCSHSSSKMTAMALLHWRMYLTVWRHRRGFCVVWREPVTVTLTRKPFGAFSPNTDCPGTNKTMKKCWCVYSLVGIRYAHKYQPTWWLIATILLLLL